MLVTLFPPLQREFTPLHWAATYGHEPIVALLLSDPRVSSRAKASVLSRKGFDGGLDGPLVNLPRIQLHS